MNRWWKVLCVGALLGGIMACTDDGQPSTSTGTVQTPVGGSGSTGSLVDGPNDNDQTVVPIVVNPVPVVAPAVAQ